MAEANPAQVEKFLKGVNYPANKQNLVKHAEQQGADPEVREVLQKLPEQTYNSPVDVNKAIGQIDRQR